MALLAAQSVNPLAGLLAVAMGAWAYWNGLKTWRGDEMQAALRYEGNRRFFERSGWGTRRQYKSNLGSGYWGLVGGPGLVIVGVGFLLAALFGQDGDWWLVWVTSLAGFGALALGVLFMLVYWFLGVPDWVRPPCQRGWEWVRGELQLVRPEAFGEHPKHRGVRDDGQPSGYDPWR